MYVSKPRVLLCVLRLVPNLDITLSSRELSVYVCMPQTYIHSQRAFALNRVCMFQNHVFCRVLDTLAPAFPNQNHAFWKGMYVCMSEAF